MANKSIIVVVEESKECRYVFFTQYTSSDDVYQEEGKMIRYMLI